MLPEESIIKRFSDRAINRYGSLYFRRFDAIDVVQAGDEIDVAVLGIDGLELEGDLVYSRLDLVTNYSSLAAPNWSAFRREANARALEFLRGIDEQGKDLIFDLVLASDHVWRSLRASQKKTD